MKNVKPGKAVYPVPQFITYAPERLLFAGIAIHSDLSLSERMESLLQKTFFLKSLKATPDTELRITVIDTDVPGEAHHEAYKIAVFGRSIHISCHAEAGLFYALKTLPQLMTFKAGAIEIPHVQITDFPDVAARGTVEGFYGEPWSTEDRISQLRFYGDVKMNTYIYAPKDDPFHSSPRWREPYPAGMADAIRKLVREAAENFVDFVWAIHPGRDIVWNEDDRINLLNKFEMMYRLGVRSFAVFFDDISGEGINPIMQAALLNFLHTNFVIKYPDVKPLILCPTQYNRSWADPGPDAYLDILGRGLDKSVRILWTGDRVISDISKDGIEWVNERIRRKAFYWWNFPVNDYVRDHLLMGPVYGNDREIKDDISGFVCNPMEHAEASKIGIFGVASYLWNMQAYDAQKSFDQAVQYVAPRAMQELKLFAENNSDLGLNGHGYRREETAGMQPLIAALEKSLTGKPDLRSFGKVYDYFERIAAAPAKLADKARNKKLISEIKPWLDQFALLGEAGANVLLAFKNYDTTKPSLNWNNYLLVNRLIAEMKYIDSTQNQNPYQPGIKTGSLVLTPFVKNAFQLLGNRILGNPLRHRKRRLAYEGVVTNIVQLEAQSAFISEDGLSISPYYEPILMQPGCYIGLRWMKNRMAQSIRFNFDVAGFGGWGVFEVSPNGTDWAHISKSLHPETGSFPLDPYVYFIRFINNSETSHTMFLKEFTVRAQIVNNNRDLSLVRDKDPTTYILISPGSHVKISVKKAIPIRLFMDNHGQNIHICNDCNADLYSGKNNYIEIEADAVADCKRLEIHNRGLVPVQLFEVMQHP